MQPAGMGANLSKAHSVGAADTWNFGTAGRQRLTPTILDKSPGGGAGEVELNPEFKRLFKLAYGVLNRLQRAVLTADILGEFVEARAHLQRVSADDPCNSHLLFPEQHEYTADPLKFLDSEHATALPHRGVPDAISGARPMIKGAGVHAAWSRNCCNSSKVLPRYLSDKVPDSRVQRLNPKP